MTIKDFKHLSGIKPTGDLTLGNYLGVIKPAVDLGNENKSVNAKSFVLIKKLPDSLSIIT